MTGNSGSYLGREEQIDRLADLVAAAASGAGTFAVIRGPAGAGTTATARLVAERAAGKGFAVLSGTFTDGLQGRPFGALAEVLDGRAAALDGSSLYAELADGAAPLARLAPLLRSRLTAIPPPAPLNAPDERLRLSDAYQAWLARAAARNALFVILDDLQWADDDAVDLLAFLQPRLASWPVLLLATWADHRPPTTTRRPLARLVEGAQLIEIGGLDMGATRVLVARYGGRPLTTGELRLVQRLSAGQPLAAQQAYLLLRDEGLVGGPPNGERQPLVELPRRLEDVVAWRMATLSLEGRSALGALACFRNGAPAALVAHVAGLSRGHAIEALEQAATREMAVAEEGRRRYAIGHERIRRAVLATLAPGVRAHAYRRAAELVEAEGAADERQLAPLLCELYAASAGVPGADRGLRHCLVAAEQARAAGAYRRAVDILGVAGGLLAGAHEPAAKRTADRGPLDDLQQRLLQAQAEAGLADAALRTAEGLLAPRRGRSANDLEVRPIIDAARVLRAHGHERHVGRLARLAHRAPGVRDRLTAARLAVLAEGWQVANDGLRAALWRQADEAAAGVLLADGDEADRAALFAPPRARTHEQTVALLGLSRQWRRPASLLAALHGACTDLTTRLGRYPEARAWAEQYLAAAERYGSPRDTAQALLFLSRCQAVLGELEAAATSLAAADDVLGRLADAVDLADRRLLSELTLAHYRDGDWHSLLATLQARRREGAGAAGMLLAAESALASARVNDEGDARPAIEAVLELAERWPALTYLRDEALLVSLTAAWDLGWAVHAVRGAALLEPLLEAGAGGNHAATPGLAKARLHALAGRLDEARAGFEAERTGLTREGRRPLRAIVDHDEGVALAAGGGVATAAASALLQQAGDAFARLGMEGWQARAQRLLDEGFAAAAQPGGRLHFTYPLSLSRREIDLVRLLTGGAVLAEAAALLEIDRPAAERHLAAALAKLGARGPADLPRLARRHGLAGQG